MEKRTADGTVEVLFPDGAVKIVQADGMEKWSLPDGTAVQIFTNGDKILTLPNGQREIHTKDLKVNELILYTSLFRIFFDSCSIFHNELHEP